MEDFSDLTYGIKAGEDYTPPFRFVDSNRKVITNMDSQRVYNLGEWLEDVERMEKIIHQLNIRYTKC